jgi:hypothetical protein
MVSIVPSEDEASNYSQLFSRLLLHGIEGELRDPTSITLSLARSRE